jgi:hypothetical protein
MRLFLRVGVVNALDVAIRLAKLPKLRSDRKNKRHFEKQKTLRKTEGASKNRRRFEKQKALRETEDKIELCGNRGT